MNTERNLFTDDYIDSDDLLALYKKDVNQYPLLSPEEEISLAKKMKSRDPEEADMARGSFINSNLRMVMHIANKYTDLGLPYMDIIQFGNMGLISAVDHFDYNKGYKFSTLAFTCINRSIQRGITDRKSPKDTISLDGSEFNLPQLVDSNQDINNITDKNDTSLQVKRVLSSLKNERARKIMEYRFGFVDGERRTLKETCEEIGGVSKERIRQIEGKTIKKLRKNAAEIDLREYK